MPTLNYASGREIAPVVGTVGSVCSTDPTYDDDLSDKAVEVAAFLLGERLYLSALEYYFEQLDRGKRISVLDHFFADANFFENISPRREEIQLPATDLIGRFQSISTLDSIDIGRISDDGNNLEEKLKVLEYELRRKNEEIKNLRNELTALTVGRVADVQSTPPCDYTPDGLCRNPCENHQPPLTAGGGLTAQCRLLSSTPSASSASASRGDILPHELRALSVLVNEHLVQQNYRLTAVQFAEESEAALGLQDIDSWEEVGIDSPKPISLLHLLRTYWDSPQAYQSAVSLNNATVPLCMATVAKVDVAIATDITGAQPHAHDILVDYHSKISELESKEDQLRAVKSHVDQLEQRNQQLTDENRKWRNHVICLNQELAEVTKRPAPINEAALSWSTSLDWSPSANMLSSRSHPDEPIPSSQHSVTADGNQLADPLNSRTPSPSLLAHLTNMLPEERSDEDFDGGFLLASSRDEFVRLVASHLQAVLPTASDDLKALTLPLLTQVICLHPSASVRDDLIRLLLGLFSGPPPVGGHPGAAADSVRSRPEGIGCSPTSPVETPPSATPTRAGWQSTPVAFGLLAGPPATGGLGDQQKQRLLILRACQRLASCIGPTRVESELLAQLWSQLNERPQPDTSRRHLLVSACGVIAPFVPVHLQSSLVLSILEANLDEERDDRVRSASLRSLACLVCYIADRDKLTPLVQRLHRQLQAMLTRSAADCATPQLVWPPARVQVESTPWRCRSGAAVTAATVDWLLPSMAQWCLEVGCLQADLLDPWLHRLDAWSGSSPASTTGSCESAQKPCPGASLVTGYLRVLRYLIPFLHAWLLITLMHARDTASPLTAWSAALRWLSTGRRRAEQNGDAPALLSDGAMHQLESSQRDGVTTRMILGDELYTRLLHELDQVLRERNRPVSSHPVESSTDALLDAEQWPAREWMQTSLLPRLIKLLEYRPVSVSSTAQDEHSRMSLYDHEELFENFVRHHYDEHFACPWSEPIACEQMQISLAVCRYLSALGAALSARSVDRIAGICLQSKLMNRTEMGNLEFDHRALQTGLLAGYCCLLSSADAKSDRSKVRTLLTNAVFLQTRESLPLDSVRLAIWCLCLTAGNLESTLHEVVLPALRPCLACADSLVRRAAGSLLHSVIEALRYHLTVVRQTAASLSPATEHQLVQLVSQLARDDVTGQRRQISPDEADWGVLVVALAPLHSLLALVSTTAQQPQQQSQQHVQGQVTGAAEAQHHQVTTVTAGDATTVSVGGKVSVEPCGDSSETKLLELLGLLLNLVVLIDSSLENGNAQSPKVHRRQTSPGVGSPADHRSGGSSEKLGNGQSTAHDGLARIARTQHRFWTPLTQSLLQLVDRLLPSCSTTFRDQVLLPWLYHLADTNNSLPSLPQRSHLANHLFVVLSTATYVLQTEESLLLLWLLPALDRVHLDFVEVGDTRRTHEVEQFIKDLYSRMKLTVTDPSNTKAKEPSGLRNAVTSQLAKLTNRNANQSGSATTGAGTKPSVAAASGSKRRPYRINLRRP